MNLGIESERLEFRKPTREVNQAIDNISSTLSKHGHGVLYSGISPDGEAAGQRVSA